MMNSLLAKFKLGIEILETETLFAAAFPSNGAAGVVLIGVLKVSAGI